MHRYCFCGTFGVNVLDSSSGYTKNGNNILDAFFDLVDVDGVLTEVFMDSQIMMFRRLHVVWMHLSDNMKNIQLLGIYRRNCSNKKLT